jgi:hypothetical protein
MFERILVPQARFLFFDFLNGISNLIIQTMLVKLVIDNLGRWLYYRHQGLERDTVNLLWTY